MIQKMKLQKMKSSLARMMSPLMSPLRGSLTAIACGIAGIATAAAPCPTSPNREQPWLDSQLSPECRADALIAKLTTVDKKLEALGFGLEQYGLAELNASDGPAGPTHVPGTPALPNGIALAASFDPALAGEYGAIIGSEFRAAGLHGMLGPTVDIARTWRAGRVPEAYGEDPVLSASIAAPVVKAIQQQGVAVTLKHFAIYTQEQGRTGDLPFGLRPAVNNVVSERVMRQIYLPPFRAAVEEGGALGAMCAFPRINGVYACEHPLLLGILKNEWGMRGRVGPDFPDAQRSVVAAVNAGLDSGNFGLPMPKRPTPPPAPATPPAGPPAGDNLGAALGVSKVPGGVDLKTAVLSGDISEKRLDDLIRRKLITIFAVGADRTPKAAVKLDIAAAHDLALRVAEQGAVLLRNERRALPFDTSVKSIAIIGTQAAVDAQRSTPGSAFVESKALVSALDAIKARAGAIRVTYTEGSLKLGALPTVPVAALSTPDGARGLRVDYFANPNLDFSGSPMHSTIDEHIDVRTPAPIPNLPALNAWSARWTGKITPTKSGLHNFTIAGSGSGRLFLDDKLVARFDRVDFGAVSYATAQMKGGQPVKVKIEFTPREAAPLPGIQLMGTTLGVMMNFGWAEPDDRIARAVAVARAADVAVIFAADSHGEGADRSELGLPGDLNALIEAVAAVNPKTVVVLNTAGPVAMPWVQKVAAILEMWYPGDVFGKAASRLLFGDAAPQGRLPITFPIDESQGPATAERNYPGLIGADGALDNAYFDEGLLVGYRWFDARKQTPLFAFGHGLSYGALQIGKVSVSKGSSAAPSINATVKNIGARADAQVLQAYLGFPRVAGEPPKRLVAFAKITVPVGEQRDVELRIPESAFDVWDENTHRWQSVRGAFEVSLGRSSSDIVFRGQITR
jgi:beta-glucosidase